MKKTACCLAMIYFFSLPISALEEKEGAKNVDCKALNRALKTQVEKLQYAKPDDDNALLTLADINKAGCVVELSQESNRNLREGVNATFDYLARLGRSREQCPIVDNMDVLENSDEKRRIHAAFKILYCFDEPASGTAAASTAWSEQDAAAIYDILVSSKLAAVLKRKLQLAFREQRLYAPIGDNAAEYGLQVRELLHSKDSETEWLLLDVAPYIVVAAEQAASSDNEKEFIRLVGLLRRIDPDAVALPRLERMSRKNPR